MDSGPTMSPTNDVVESIQEIKTFHPADYAVFCCLFLVSAVIGLFFAIKDRKKKNSETYLLAGRKMSGLPIALSLSASFMSAITVLGIPAEVYRYGTMFSWFAVSYTIVALVTANVFVPVFYNLGISSTYEYLERRFNRAVRIAGTFCFILQTLLYMGMVMYMPGLALNKVSGGLALLRAFCQWKVEHQELTGCLVLVFPVTALDLNISIVVTALVCIFYTTIGGIKAVVWNDVVQCCVMGFGILAIIIKGSLDVGGISKVIEIANDGGRTEFWHFDIDPRVRHSFWSICIGGTLTWLSVYATNQSMVQRYLTCRSLFQAKLSLFFNDLSFLVILTLSILCGLVMYAIYAGCDPLSKGIVTKSDQLVPYLVMDILSVAPGIPGIFVASAYSGTLSTISTGINSLACSTYEDLIKPNIRSVSGARALLISKILVIIYGLLGLGVAYLATLMDRILTIALKMFGIIGGPVLGIFCLGLFTPVGNAWGALSGLFVGLVVGVWLGIGSFLYPPANEFVRLLPLSTEGCSNITNDLTSFNNNSFITAAGMDPSMPAGGLVDSLYALSYCHYPTLLVSLTWIVGILVSLATGGLKSCHKVSPALLAYSGSVCCCFGKKTESQKGNDSDYSKDKLEDEILMKPFKT